MDPSNHEQNIALGKTGLELLLESLAQRQEPVRSNLVDSPIPSPRKNDFALAPGPPQKIWILEEQIIRQAAASAYTNSANKPSSSSSSGWPTSLPVHTPSHTNNVPVPAPSSLIENKTLKYLFSNPTMTTQKKTEIEEDFRVRNGEDKTMDFSKLSLKEILGNVIDVFEMKSVLTEPQPSVRPPPGFENVPNPGAPSARSQSAPWVPSRDGSSLGQLFNMQLPIAEELRKAVKELHSSGNDKSVKGELNQGKSPVDSQIVGSQKGSSRKNQVPSDAEGSSQKPKGSGPPGILPPAAGAKFDWKAFLLSEGKPAVNKPTSVKQNAKKELDAGASARGDKSEVKNNKSCPPGILPPAVGPLFDLKSATKAENKSVSLGFFDTFEPTKRAMRKKEKKNKKREEEEEQNAKLNAAVGKPAVKYSITHLSQEKRSGPPGIVPSPVALLDGDAEKVFADFGSFKLANEYKSGPPGIIPPPVGLLDGDAEKVFADFGSFKLATEDHDAEDDASNTQRRRKRGKRKGCRNRNRSTTLESNDCMEVPRSNEGPSSHPQQRSPNTKQNEKESFAKHWDKDAVAKGLQNKTLIKGEFRINPKNYKECYISDPDEGKDILISGVLDRNRALEGDIVAVKLKSEEDNANSTLQQKTGQVVSIIERVHTGDCVGSISNLGGSDFVTFCPRDSRIPRFNIPVTTIPVQILQNPEVHKDMLFKARISTWCTPKFAVGLFIDSLGRKGELEAETKAILEVLNLDSNPVPDELIKNLNLHPVTQDEISKRLDLRQDCIFTIDPATARDLDDAVSIEKLGDNLFKVGVHISDVTHYLELDSQLDQAVAARATTIYLVDRAIHMLPMELCVQCSLLPGMEKLAMSVIWEMDGEGNILSENFARTVIHSCCKLSYEQAQAIIDGKSPDLTSVFNGKTPEDIKQSILHLQSLAVHMRNRRFEGGALRIDQPKVNFRVDQSSMPISVAVEVLRDSNRLIEEYMLQANQSVAQYIHKHHPKIALLRRHAPPKVAMIDKLIQSMASIGIKVDSTSAKDIHKCIVENSAGERSKQIVLSSLFSKPMMRAEYFCYDPESHHYALNVDMYTHFTSPIRRYADIVVHRLLCTIIADQGPPKWKTEDVRGHCATSNKKKYAAKRAGEQSSELFTALYIRQKGPFKVEGIVHNVISHALDIIITVLALNVRVYLNRLPATLVYDCKGLDSSLTVVWNHAPNRPVVYKMFSTLEVQLSTPEDSLTVEAQLLPPTSMD